jgi:non-specific serine/threonine protein kinase/serine/threonine-protein kinase
MAEWNPHANELFLEALDRAPGPLRAAFLDQACEHDHQLKAQVVALLEASNRACDFLSSPAQEFHLALIDGLRGDGQSTVIGPYKLLEEIGEGGMGVVWMAKQSQPVRRTVALKLLKPGMDSRQVLARFEAERQALAMMDHPNIAKVLDAGTTGGVGQAPPDILDNRCASQAQPDLRSGRPYFVMELVKGVPITTYCDEMRLTVKERLNLFIPVCQAIQHAHQKGIIHRDIKPSNILVALYDGVPVPKVIDFGVAKAIGPKLTEKTMFTGFGQLIGTLEYMSPEQAQLNQLDIDTRSDIYSLGVLLYELLAGTMPFDQAHLRKLAFDETLRMIREVEPPKPSTKISTSERLAMIAANRSAEPIQLGRQVKGDLDWIVIKCLEKDRSRRYQTASALEMDLRRYLSHEPVIACPPSRAYLLRKFVQRNRGPVLSVFLVLLALIGGIIGATWGMFRAEQARQNAEAAELAQAELAKNERQAKEETQKRLAQIEIGTDTLASIIQDINLMAAENEGVTLRDLLGRRLREAAQQLDGEAVGDPLVVARLQHVLGVALRELGDLQHAEAVLAKACQTRVRLLGDDDLHTVATKHELALVYREQAEYDLAETLYNEALATRTSRLGSNDPDTLMSQHQLAVLYHSQGKHNLAESFFGEVIKHRTARLGADNADTLTSRHRLALVYRSQGKFDAAEEMCREVLQRRIATLDHDHLDTLGSKHLLAVLHGIKGQFHLAQPLYQEVLRVRTAKQGADHPDTLTSRHHLALLYASMDKPDQAIPMLKETLALRKIRLSPEHPSTLDTQADLGINLCNAGRQAEGIVQLEEVHQKGLSDRRLVRVTGILLGAYLRAGKTAKARALAEELLQTARDKFADDSLDHFAALADAGWLLTEWKSFADAEPLLREAVSRGDSFFVDSWRTHHARLLLGVALLGQQKFADAEPLLVLGYEALRERESQIPRETGAPLDQSVQWAVELYEAAGQAGKAADWRTRLEDQTTRSDK